MSETERKTLQDRIGTKHDGQARTHSQMTLLRDGLRSWRGRLRWLFALSGFVMVGFSMVLIPVSIVISERYFGDIRDADTARMFLDGSLSLAMVMLQLGIIFKLYAHAIDLEIWYYSLVGSQPPSLVSMKTKFLKLCSMSFIALAMIFLAWGISGNAGHDPAGYSTVMHGTQRFSVDLVRQAMIDKSFKLTVLSLLMAILSLLYFNEVKRDELRARSEAML